MSNSNAKGAVMEVRQIIESFRRVLTEHYADFQGRAARTTFWHYILVYLVLSILLDILGIRLLSTVLGLALLVPTLAISVRPSPPSTKTASLVPPPPTPPLLS